MIQQNWKFIFLVAMADDCKNRRSISHSVLCLPVLENVTKSSFLLQTPIPKINNAWVQGAPTPIATGSLSPNEQVVALLAGFASGKVTMEGESIKHLPSTLLRQLPSPLVKFGAHQDENLGLW